MKIRTLLFAVIALLAASTAQAQQRRITGRVAAVDGGAPLSSASITIVGSTTGTYTNEQGQFSIPAPATTVTLRVRRIGYQQRNVVVPVAQNELLVTLVKDVLQLEAQVVTGTSTAVSSLNAANAVSTVTAEALTRVASPTIDNALQGKIAGAVISSNSGAPGGGTQVQLRGVSSILGAYSPLYVVDGVIVNNGTINGGLNVITNALARRQPGQPLLVSGSVGEPHRRPQPEQHREHPGAEGPLGVVDLRIEGHERRHRHHDEAGHRWSARRRRDPARRPILAGQQARFALLRLGRRVRRLGEHQPRPERRDGLRRVDRGDRRSATTTRRSSTRTTTSRTSRWPRSAAARRAARTTSCLVW